MVADIERILLIPHRSDERIECHKHPLSENPDRMDRIVEYMWCLIHGQELPELIVLGRNSDRLHSNLCIAMNAKAIISAKHPRSVDFFLKKRYTLTGVPPFPSARVHAMGALSDRILNLKPTKSVNWVIRRPN